ncbi:MAG: hypothetical protein Q8O42_09505 [Acidobacteriota bacterium]|nr:hypothetical protein [Acidobacteriota bacterium]
MAITEVEDIECVEVLRDGHVQVRRAARVFRDEVEIAVRYHRSVIDHGAELPGDVAAWLHARLHNRER